jgi:hypothetical protein
MRSLRIRSIGRLLSYQVLSQSWSDNRKFSTGRKYILVFCQNKQVNIQLRRSELNHQPKLLFFKDIIAHD